MLVTCHISHRHRTRKENGEWEGEKKERKRIQAWGGTIIALQQEFFGRTDWWFSFIIHSDSFLRALPRFILTPFFAGRLRVQMGIIGVVSASGMQQRCMS